MSDYQAVFDAIEQFKRDHPDYERARKIWEQCRAILDATKPKYETVTAPTTAPWGIMSDNITYRESVEQTTRKSVEQKSQE